MQSLITKGCWGLIAFVEQLNFRKIKLVLGPSQRLQRAVGDGGRLRLQSFAKTAPFNCTLATSKNLQFQKAPENWSEEAQCKLCNQGAILSTTSSCLAALRLKVPLTGDSSLLIQLETLLSTNVQSLEHSIQESTKLGPVKRGQPLLQVWPQAPTSRSWIIYTIDSLTVLPICNVS